MNPINFNDDDDLNYSLFYPNQNMHQRTQRSHTAISNTNNDNLNQEQKLFPQNLKQFQQMFQKRTDRQKGSNNEQFKGKKESNQQNLLPYGHFQPFNVSNIQKQTQISQPTFPQIQNIKEIPPLHNPKIKIQEHFSYKKSQTLENCRQCLLPKDADHQCNDEYGLINCPYCSEHIVRNFLDDHLVDCIQYIEHQFSNLDTKEECIICMEDLVKDKQMLQCSHSFHISCIDVWKAKSHDCPVCRKPI